MRTQRSLNGAVGAIRHIRRSNLCTNGRRFFQISSTPTVESPRLTRDVLSSSSADSADARFEVLGTPYSLLSVSLSASQKLFTRRGTLVGVSGKAENAQSTLSILEPFRRALFGIPFLYQRISSTSPLSVLISTKSPITSLSVLHLDGTVDWMISQRNALLAWTGHNLSVSPTVNRSMSLAHWGNTKITGRGLAAVTGPGQIYQLKLQPGEKYVAHPGNVVAYTITQNTPLPYRFRSSNLRFQVPDAKFSAYFPEVKFFRVMKETTTWKAIAKLSFSVRTMARRTIWGDRLFLQFQGPTTILMSSRASRISDVLTKRDVDEIADTEAGVVQSAVTLASTPKEDRVESTQKSDVPTGFKMATVTGGEVKFEDVKSIEELKAKN